MKYLILLPILLSACGSNGITINECYNKGNLLVKFRRLDVDAKENLIATISVCNIEERSCVTSSKPYEKLTFETTWTEVQCPNWVDY